jgi:hypothetical protein
MAWINAFGETIQGDMPANTMGYNPAGAAAPNSGGGASSGGSPDLFSGFYGGYGSNAQPTTPQAQGGGTGGASGGGGAFNDYYGSFGAGSPTGWQGTTTGSTRPEQYTGTDYGGGASGGAASTGPYKTPDWLRNSALMVDQSPETQRAFFAANPQYEEDWKRIQAGGNSQYATDGSTLIRSNFDNMSPEAAAYYRDNKDELLANEGFGHDPTLAYMNYYGGPASIGANNKTMNMSSYLQQNRWTPNGVVGGANNPLMYANTPYGSGTAGYLNGRPGQPTPGAQGAGGAGAQGRPGGVIGGGISSGSPQTGGVYPQPYGSGGGSGSSYGGGSGSSSSGMGPNPYLQQQADAMTGTMTDNWRRNVQPQLASGAQLAGGYGGSRQGVIEANSANDLNQGIGAALANLFANGYSADRSYDLGLRNNELGWGNLGLGYSNLDRNINNDNLGWQMQGAQFGLSLQDRLMNNNQLGLAAGTQINDNAYNNWNRFSQGASSMGNGYGTTTGTSTTPGNVIGGALGGAQLGGRIGNWWGSTQGPNTSNFWAPNFSGSMGD